MKPFTLLLVAAAAGVGYWLYTSSQKKKMGFDPSIMDPAERKAWLKELEESKAETRREEAAERKKEDVDHAAHGHGAQHGYFTTPVY